MIALVTFFLVMVVSLLVVRVASAALAQTGLSTESARFQARSAWTGTGFTTEESERVVSHPVRRRIISILMVLRSAGLVTVLSTLIISFAATGDNAARLQRLLWLVGGLGLLWVLSKSAWVDRRLNYVIHWSLDRWTDLDVRDYAELLHIAYDYGVTELKVRGDDWLCGRTLGELNLPAEGILVLGVQRPGPDGEFIGVPRGPTRIAAGDTVTLYGRTRQLAELDKRQRDPEGERAHDRSARIQKKVLEHQADEPAAERPGGPPGARP